VGGLAAEWSGFVSTYKGIRKPEFQKIGRNKVAPLSGVTFEVSRVSQNHAGGADAVIDIAVGTSNNRRTGLQRPGCIVPAKSITTPAWPLQRPLGSPQVFDHAQPGRSVIMGAIDACSPCLAGADHDSSSPWALMQSSHQNGIAPRSHGWKTGHFDKSEADTSHTPTIPAASQ
jgi:hypothetical protein